jgi:hypothetical protein
MKTVWKLLLLIACCPSALVTVGESCTHSDKLLQFVADSERVLFIIAQNDYRTYELK